MTISGSLLTAMLLGAAASSAPAATLSALQWKYRVVVTFAPDAQDSRLQRQSIQVHRLTHAADDRDIVEVKVAGDRVAGSSDSASALRQRFNIPVDVFRALLIGKDGGVKISSAKILPARRIAATIDAMPMRRDETRR